MNKMTSSPPCASVEFIRRDFTTEIISRRAAAFNLADTPLKADEDAVDQAARRGDWIEVAALGMRLTDKWHGRLRGPLAYHDGLFELKLYADSERVLRHALSNAVTSSPLLQRLVRIYGHTARWEEALRVFEDHAVTRENVACIREVIAISILLKRFDLATQASAADGLKQEDRGHIAHHIHKAESRWASVRAPFQAMADSKSVLSTIAEANESGDLDTAEGGVWFLYEQGNRSIEFLDVATGTLPREDHRTPRVMFFRNLAQQLYPASASYADLFVRSCFCTNRFDEAYRTLSEHAMSLNSPEHLVLRTRAADIVGRPLEPSTLATIANRANGVGQMLTLRAANMSTWVGDQLQAANYSLPLLARTEVPEHQKALRLASPPPQGRSRIHRPRVAVCISGQLRSARQNLPKIYESIAKPLDADVFIHTWSREQSTPPRFRHIERFLGAELTKMLPPQFCETPAFAARFPKTTQRLQMRVETAVTADWIREMTPFVHMVVEKEESFESNPNIGPGLWFARKLNQAKLFHKIHACDNLRRAHELNTGRPYDAVIRIRPDLQIQVPWLEDFVHDAIAFPNRVYVHYADVRGTGDQFAIAAPAAMKAYAGSWPFLCRQQRFDYLPGFDNEPAEILVSNHMIASGLETRIIPTNSPLLAADLAVDHHDLTQDLESDMNSVGEPGDVRGFYDFYVEWLKRNPTFANRAQKACPSHNPCPADMQES